MTYNELDSIVEGAWSVFFDHLAFNGINTEDVADSLDTKDCFNDIFDAIISHVDLEEE